MPVSDFKYPKPISTPAKYAWAADNFQRTTSKLKYDLEQGGVALNDASQGLTAKPWKAYYKNNKVYIHPTDDPLAAVELFEANRVSEITLSFDFNMQPIVAYMQNDILKLWWHDGTVNQKVILEFPGNKSPLLVFDERRPKHTTIADVLLFYVRDNKIYCRQMRDRFLQEYIWLEESEPIQRILSAGMNAGYRMQLTYSLMP